MKQLLFTFAFLTSFISHAQWLEGGYIDELGKETGETFDYQTITGQFSNSRVECSRCVYFIEHNKKEKVLGVIIYPFGGEDKEEWREDTLQDFQLITPTGKLVQIETFCFDGMMFFSEKEYKQLMRAIKKSGKYKAFCDYDDGESISTYVFNFEN